MRLLQPGNAGGRRGLTLVELLVVMGIILILATIVVVSSFRFEGPARTASGSDQLQKWLLIAKQRARRDQAIRGVRLYAKEFRVKEAQYLEQPDDLVLHHKVDSRSEVRRIAVNSGTLNMVELEGTLDALATDFLSAKLNQDGPHYIEINGGGVPHRITAVRADGLTISPPMTYPVPATSQYRIIRGPRPMSGETPMDLPTRIVIDLKTNVAYGNQLPPGIENTGNGNLDILFGPSGQVVNWRQATDKVILWVRDEQRDTEFEGDPRLITVFIRTGFIGAFSVDNSNDPYSHVRSGQASGL